LPTEAEWEYACRAGTRTAYSFGHAASQLGDYAWYRDNSGRKTHPVGQKKPNPWGLYDMHGNVFETCQDWFGAYDSSAAVNPAGPSRGSYRVRRGGSSLNNARFCQSGDRSGRSPRFRYHSIGFRLAQGPLSKAKQGGSGAVRNSR